MDFAQCLEALIPIMWKKEDRGEREKKHTPKNTLMIKDEQKYFCSAEKHDSVVIC